MNVYLQHFWSTTSIYIKAFGTVYTIWPYSCTLAFVFIMSIGFTSQKSYDHLLFGQTLLIAQNCINWNVCSADQLVVFVLFFHFRLLKKYWCDRGFLWFWSFIVITDGSLARISQNVKSVCFCNSFSVNLLWHSRLNVCLEIPHFAACT